MRPPKPNQDNSPADIAGSAGEPRQSKVLPEESERWLQSSIDDAEGDWENEDTRFHSRLLDVIRPTGPGDLLERRRSATVRLVERGGYGPEAEGTSGLRGSVYPG